MIPGVPAWRCDCAFQHLAFWCSQFPVAFLAGELEYAMRIEPSAQAAGTRRSVLVDTRSFVRR
jgi:hypothetical protein